MTRDKAEKILDEMEYGQQYVTLSEDELAIFQPLADDCDTNVKLRALNWLTRHMP